jgi:hypothetical protein
MASHAPTEEPRPSEATYAVVFTWTGYLQDFLDEPDTEGLLHKVLSQPLHDQKLDGKDIMEIAMLHPVWCHELTHAFFSTPSLPKVDFNSIKFYLKNSKTNSLMSTTSQ